MRASQWIKTECKGVVSGASRAPAVKAGVVVIFHWRKPYYEIEKKT